MLDLPESGTRLPGVVAFVRSLDGEYYLLREVAQMLGVSPTSVRALNSPLHPELRPSGLTRYKQTRLYLYSRDDIERLREHYARNTSGVGRPRQYTPEQYLERSRKQDLLRYYRRRVLHLEEARNRSRKWTKAKDRMQQLEAELREQEAALAQ